MKLKYNDRWHSYHLNGTRCKGVTNVAGIPDDTYNLQNWQKRMVALGMALPDSKPLHERALAHFDDKSALGDVAEDAMRAAKAHDAAARGTAIHRTLERHDLGGELIDTPESRALRAAYDKALDAAGLIVLPEYIERVVVHDKHFIAGRFDRLFRRKRDGKLVVGDIKSGENAIKYPHKTAVQLALYANAPLLAGPIPGSGGETETFEKFPETDKKWAYVVFTPDANHVAVHKIDIAKGWKAFNRAILPTLEWRKEANLIQVVGTVEVDDLMGPAPEERVTWIKGRLQLLAIVDNADRAKQLVALRWPASVPKPKDVKAGAAGWSEQDIDELDAVLTSVEDDVSAGFAPSDPTRERMAA